MLLRPSAARLASRGLSRAGSRLQQLCTAAAPTKLTKIVATIGPASEEEQPLRACVAAGMNVMRVNFSHATADEFHLRRTNLRAAPGGEIVPIMLDTKGPEIRMGGLRVCRETGERKAKVLMEAGSEILLTTDAAFDGDSDASTLYVGYELLREKLAAGDKVLLDDGLVILEVAEVTPAGVRCVITNTSEIGERKGVNLPGIVTDLPPMSEKDRADIAFGVEHDIDMVAASFVRNAEGVREIRGYLQECHEKYASDPASTPLPLIISKIESTEALDNLHEIIAESDGIMVARGDLGVEIPLEEVITWQKEMVGACVAVGKPVVVATQMLESMQKNPRPTRAEVADVTNAVLDDADAVMLSGESANGKYPDHSVATQGSICASAEAWARKVRYVGGGFDNGTLELLDDIDDERPLSIEAAALALSACTLAEEVEAAAIVVVEPPLGLLQSVEGQGALTRAVSQGGASRPAMPIIALSSSLKVCRQLGISRGVFASHVPSLPSSPAEAAAAAVSAGLVPEGAPLVVLADDSLTTTFA